MSVDRLSRRRALSAVASVGSLGVVGCLGGRREPLVIGVGPADSRSHQAGHALAVAVDRHSDRLRLNVTSVGPPSERLYELAAGTIDAAGVDNTTLYRASEERGVFDLDPIDQLPAQGVAYGRRDHYWLAVDDHHGDNDDRDTDRDSEPPTASTLAADRTVYPGQPSTPSRLVTEQLCRNAELWNPERVDNRPRQNVADGVEAGDIEGLVARQDADRLAEWCRQLDRQVGHRLAVVPPGESLQTAINDAPNTVGREIEPADWANAAAETVDGWGVPAQWLWSRAVASDAVAELTRIALEHAETLASVDPLAADGATLADGHMDELAIHEGAASALDEHLDDRERD